VGAPENQPNRIKRPPLPRSSSACRPAVPPTPSSASVISRPARHPARLAAIGLGIVDSQRRASWRTRSTLASPPARPTTVAPAVRATWTSRLPIPPAAAAPGRHQSHASWAMSRMPNVVRPVPIMATATSSSQCVGKSVQPLGVGHYQFGVAAAWPCRVGDDPLPEPVSARRLGRGRRPRPRLLGRGLSAVRAAASDPSGDQHGWRYR